jgi:hypothetical protein
VSMLCKKQPGYMADEGRIRGRYFRELKKHPIAYSLYYTAIWILV